MMDLFLSKLSEEKKKEFMKEIRSVKTRKGIDEILEKYGIAIPEDASRILHKSMHKEISAEDLENVSGGSCSCYCVCGCSCGCCYDYCNDGTFCVTHGCT